MSLFEPYRERCDRPAHPEEHELRPAVPSDVPALSELAAAREGGSVAARAASLGADITEWSRTGEGLLLVAQQGSRLVGFGKVRYFRAPDGAPPNVAPTGWYLAGVIVAPEHRRRGIGKSLTRARLAWVAERHDTVYYFANARNRVTLDLHQPFGFVEVTRDFTYPGVTFEGGTGILYRAATRD